MRDYPRWLLPFVVVLIVGCMVLWRVSAETWGRNGPPSVQPSDSERILKFETIGDRVEDGTVSIFSGQRIINFFRIQFPINPYIYSHSRQMDISSDRNYLITSDLELFQKIRFTVDEINVYKDNRNYVYEGVRLPDAYVMETDLSQNKIKRISLPALKSRGGEDVSQRFLPIRNQGDLKALNRLDSIPEGTSLLVYEGIDIKGLNPDQFERLREVYVMGKNARRLGSDEQWSGSQLIVLSEKRDVELSGPVPSIPRYIHWGIIGFVALILFTVSPGGITWVCWLFLVVTGIVAASADGGLVLGLLGGALLRLVHDKVNWDGVYFSLWPLFIFGASYLSYLVWPYNVETLGLLLGLAVSVAFLFTSMLFDAKRSLRVTELISIGLIGWVIRLVTSPGIEEAVESGSANLLAAITFTACFPVVTGFDRTPSPGKLWGWGPAIALWSVIPLFPSALPYLLAWPLIMGLYYFTRSGD